MLSAMSNVNYAMSNVNYAMSICELGNGQCNAKCVLVVTTTPLERQRPSVSVSGGQSTQYMVFGQGAPFPLCGWHKRKKMPRNGSGGRKEEAGKVKQE